MKIIEKQKKGFLLAEETLKLILAVIAIVFLAYLLFSLYRANRDAKDLNLAKESLAFLFQEINTQKTEVDIYNPDGWVILSWPYQDEEKRPKSCSNLGWGSCICIVDDLNLGNQLLSTLPFTTNVRDKFLKKTDEKGTCIENIKNLIVKKEGDQQQPILIENPPVKLIIDYQNKKISKG